MIYAEDIEAHEFDLVVHTWADTQIFGVSGVWIAEVESPRPAGQGIGQDAWTGMTSWDRQESQASLFLRTFAKETEMARPVHFGADRHALSAFLMFMASACILLLVR